jgi:uncharacterized protein (TIGR02271 family)
MRKTLSVYDSTGALGWIDDQIIDPANVTVELADHRRVYVPRAALEMKDPSTYYLGSPFDSLEQVPDDLAFEQVLPVMAETLKVERKRVDTARVLLMKHVQERQEVVKDERLVEYVTVERVQKNEFVESPPPIRSDGDSIVVPIVEEVLVTEKRLLLKEEVHMRKESRVEPCELKVTLRTENVDISREEITEQAPST